MSLHQEENETDSVELPLSLAMEASQALNILQPPEETRETDETFPSNRKTKKKHNLQHISCWVLLLTFALLTIQSMFSFFNELLLNDRFWENTKQFITLYKKDVMQKQ